MSFTTVSNQHEVYYRYTWFHLIRPLTLTGTITPMLAGTMVAAHHGKVRLDLFLIVLVATLLIQIATNIWNDYFDFKYGQDQEKWRNQRQSKKTPAYDELPYIAVLFTSIACILGVWLALRTTWWLIPIGLSGIGFGFFYSAGKKSLSAIGLGEMIGAIFLGLATTILPYIVQGNPVNKEIILVAIPFAILIASMILTNNIRDIEKDAQFRRTIAQMLGRKQAITLLIILISVIYTWTIGLIAFHFVPFSVFITFLALPLSLRLWQTLKTGKMTCMKFAALHHWTFGLLFTSGLLIGLIT